MIAYQSFTPFVSFVGGCMIGLAVVILFLGDRRIAGVSGIFGEILTGLGGEGRGWRLLFVAGMLLAPWFVTGSGAGDSAVVLHPETIEQLGSMRAIRAYLKPAGFEPPPLLIVD